MPRVTNAWSSKRELNTENLKLNHSIPLWNSYYNVNILAVIIVLRPFCRFEIKCPLPSRIINRRSDPSFSLLPGLRHSIPSRSPPRCRTAMEHYRFQSRLRRTSNILTMLLMCWTWWCRYWSWVSSRHLLRWGVYTRLSFHRMMSKDECELTLPTYISHPLH